MIDKEVIAKKLAEEQGVDWGELTSELKDQYLAVAQERIELYEKDQAEKQAAEPAAEQQPTGPIDETVAVECGNPECGGKFEFPIKSDTQGFSFTCTACGSQNRWER